MSVREYVNFFLMVLATVPVMTTTLSYMTGVSMLAILTLIRLTAILWFWESKMHTILYLLQKKTEIQVNDLCTRAIRPIACIFAAQVVLQWIDGAMISAMPHMLVEFTITFTLFVVNSRSRQFYDEYKATFVWIKNIVHIAANYDDIRNAMANAASLKAMAARFTGNSSEQLVKKTAGEANQDSWFGKTMNVLTAVAGVTADAAVLLTEICEKNKDIQSRDGKSKSSFTDVLRLIDVLTED